MMRELGTARIAVLTVPEIRLGCPLGGAEAVADGIVRRLSTWFDIVVLHGHQRGRFARRTVRELEPGISARDAFPITAAVQERGIIPVDSLYPEAREQLARCDALLEFERVVAGLSGILRYAIVGGTCYPHCRECAISTEWDRLIVPSCYVADTAIAEWGVEGRGVQVIPNGLDATAFGPSTTLPSGTRDYPLLVAGRPDIGKGHAEALEFARACQAAGHDVSVHCFRQDSFLDVDGFYHDLRNVARGVRLRLRPWVPRYEMPQIYREVAMTLCLGSFPEGFGLTAVESIACGTPVLARPVGFLREVVPPDHGLEWVEADQARNLARELPNLVGKLSHDCRERGVAFVHRHYAEHRMVQAYRSLLSADLNREARHD